MRIFVTFACLCATVCIYAQNNFSAIITDSNNNPIESATVTWIEQNQSVVTNANGQFTFQNFNSNNSTISVSRLGYNAFTQKISSTELFNGTISLTESTTNLEEVIVEAVRAKNNTPTTFTLIEKRDIKSVSTVQDAPYLLANEPSVVVTSDAGAGIGYTGMRIRGVAANKINVTVNGIPLNDAESHGVYWVDVPDIASSAQSIQIQRGVGTSTNGSGAFGASINLNTDKVSEKPFVQYNGAAGSFNTLKNSVHVASGKFNEHYFFEAKGSAIKSDGYRDRSWSNLKSYFAQTGYISDNTLIKLVAFGGREETYQAWFGVDSATMKINRTFNYNGAIYNNDYSVKGYYNNQIDHYEQDHVQLHWAQKITDNLKLNTALHYTYGRGYYEEYLQNQDLLFYGLNNVKLTDTSVISTSDVIRRLWLDNQYYGGVWGLAYSTDRLNITWGGGIQNYNPGKHYGEVIWAQYFTNDYIGKKFYNNTSTKLDANTFIKASYNITPEILAFTDYQVRYINYKAKGYNKEYADAAIDFEKQFIFHNPKVGVKYQFLPTTAVYASYAIAHREPTRSDFIDSPLGTDVKSEVLFDLELGLRHNDIHFFGEVVFYNMQYNNELALTGALNGVGTPLRSNVGSSVRRGVELIGGYKISSVLKFEANATISENRIKELYVSESDSLIKKTNVEMAFSPSLIAGSKITITPIAGFESVLYYRHVSQQYLNNNKSEALSINPYNVFDFITSYTLNSSKNIQYAVSLKINNFLNENYSSNGFVLGGVGYYYPQAFRHYMVGLTVKF